MYPNNIIAVNIKIIRMALYYIVFLLFYFLIICKFALPSESKSLIVHYKKNDRTEIKLQGVSKKKPKNVSQNHDLNKELIEKLISDTKTLIKAGKLNEAISRIKKAKKLGGEKYSGWYSTYGIIGFTGGIKPADLIPIFKLSLALDPYNTEARDYLGRVMAREKFLTGKIVKQMGRSLDNPIKVATVSQEYEYIKLFDVKPTNRFSIKNKSIDMWECTTDKNKKITYYFDSSEVYRWAYQK